MRGTFKPYRATRKVHLGPTKGDIWEDDIIEFDGYTLRLSDGGEFNVPSVRGAINNGWLVDAADTESGYVARPAGIMMTPADTTKDTQPTQVGRVTMSDTQRVVGSYQTIRQGVASGQSNLVLDPNSPQDRTPIVTVDHGVEVAKIGNPTHSRPVVGSAQATSNQVSRILRRPVDAQIREDLKGQGSDDRYLTPEDRQVIAEVQSQRAAAAAQAEAAAEQRRMEGAEVAKKYGYRGDPTGGRPVPKPTQDHADAVAQSGGFVFGEPKPNTGGMHPEVAKALTDLWQTKRDLAHEKWEAEKDKVPELTDADRAQIEALTQARLELERQKMEVTYQKHKEVITSHLSSSVEERSDLDVDLDVEPTQEDIDTTGEYEETFLSTIMTGSGTTIEWDRKSGKWAARVKRAKELYGTDKATLLGIADIEIDAVAKRLRSHAESLSN